MTAITIWCNHEVKNNPTLWVAADSRVSGVSNSVLIEDGAKIFSLPVVCRAPGSEGFFSEVSYAHSYGYCFAGSTLMGQNAYLGLVPLLGNLISVHGYVPSITDVGKYVHSYLRHTFDDYKFRVSQKAFFEVALFGYCCHSKTLSAFHFYPQLDEEGIYTMVCSEYLNMKDRSFIYLGDEKTQINERLMVALAGASVPGRPISRIPRHVIQDCIDDESFPSIGGDIQLGIADVFGFRLYALCKPRVVGQGAAYFSYLGRELSEVLTSVGEAKFGGPFMT